MLFNLKFKHYSLRMITSDQVRAILKAEGLSVKEQKKYIAKAIRAFRENKGIVHSQLAPYVTVERNSISHMNMPSKLEHKPFQETLNGTEKSNN